LKQYKRAVRSKYPNTSKSCIN